MIHEDLEGEALKDEVLRVARRGSVYDLDAEMTVVGRKVGVELAWLGKRQTAAGDEVIFRFYAPSGAAQPLAHIHNRPALVAKLRHMAKNCGVLVKEIAWHPHSESGVLTVLWDSVTPMGSEPRADNITAMLDAGVSDEAQAAYRRYES